MFQTGLLDDFASWYTESLTENIADVSNRLSKEGYSNELSTEIIALRGEFISWMVNLWGDESLGNNFVEKFGTPFDGLYEQILEGEEKYNLVYDEINKIA